MIKTNNINGTININITNEKEKSKMYLNETYLNIYYKIHSNLENY